MSAIVNFSALINPKSADRLLVLVGSTDRLPLRTTEIPPVETYF